MIALFHILSTPAARMRMGLRTNQIIDDVVTQAETIDLGVKDYASFDVYDLELKVVVQFVERTIHMMTCDEARRAKLPGSIAASGAHTPSRQT